MLDDFINGATSVERIVLDGAWIGDCFWVLDHRRAVALTLYSYARGEVLVKCRRREVVWWSEPKCQQQRAGADGQCIILKKHYYGPGYLFARNSDVNLSWWWQYYISRDW
jgi:hypothetical protein